MNPQTVAEKYFSMEDDIAGTERNIALVRHIMSAFALVILVGGIGLAALDVMSNVIASEITLNPYLLVAGTIAGFLVLAFGVPVATLGWKRHNDREKAKIADLLAGFAADTYDVRLDSTAITALARDPFSSVMGIRGRDEKLSNVRFTVFQDRMALLASEVEI